MGYGETVVWLAVATASLSFTLTKTAIGEAIRETITKKEIPQPEFLLALFSCPYCVAHWVALFFDTFVDIPTPGFGPGLVSSIATWFAIVGLAAIMLFVFIAIKDLTTLAIEVGKAYILRGLDDDK
jgi:hypothetical protein